MADRVAAEKEFFDRYYLREGGTALDRFYDRSAGIRRFRDVILADCAGKDVLEVGCGPGGHGIPLAQRGARVTAIDVSATAVELATDRAAAYPNLDLRYRLGNAEAMDFEAGTFDLVCGTGIVHHLDVERFAAEVRRVLRQGGVAVFYEPVAWSPLGTIYRVLTPSQHTPDEHPVVPADLELLGRHFGSVRAEFFHLLSTAAIPLLKLPGGGLLQRALEAADRPLLQLPGVRWLSAFVVLRLGERTVNR